MSTARTENFDAEMFRKLVARFDSGSANEADVAFRKALLMCAENRLSFADAIAQAYGPDDAEELQTQNAALRERLEQRERDGAQLADALDQAEKKIASLESRDEPEGRAWSGKTLLLILAGIIAARVVLYIVLGEKPPGDLSQEGPGFAPWIGNLALILSGAWLLAQWHRAQRAAAGWGQLAMKWAVLAPGLFLAASIFFDGPPWEASVFHRGPVPALVVTALTVLLVMSKFTERVAERGSARIATLSVRGMASWLAGWFV